MRRRTRRLSRLPLRHRLVAGFAATMLLVLTGAGAFVYWRVEFALDRRLNTELVKTAEALRPLVTPTGDLRQGAAVVSGLDAWQVVDADGRVLAFDPTVGDDPLLSSSAVRDALQRPVYRDVGELLPIAQRPLRLYATALDESAPGPAAVLVVATRRDQRDEALRELLGQLLAAGLGALVVTAFVGDRLARAALRPVERYRAQAAAIAGGASGIRLDVPADRDDEITRLGHTLNDVLTALESALDSERRFVNDASHELRTPLTLLTSRIQLALRRPRTVAEHEAILEELGTDVARLRRLAEQLLALGPRPANPDACTDLARLVRTVVDRHHTLAAAGTPYAAPGALDVATVAAAPVTMDPVAAEQLLDNLLENAAVHGSPPVRVRVDTAGDQVRLRVSDGGAGMDPAMLAQAPARFARAPQARARRGSGLGLALVLAIVTAAGGELRLCCGGHHERFGLPRATPCTHPQEMTVTVLLARAQQPDARVPVEESSGRDVPA